MYSKIPTATSDGSRRSPARQLNRSASLSPGKSPGKSPGRNESPGKSPTRSRGQGAVKKVTVVSPGKSPERSPGRGQDGDTGQAQAGVRYISDELIKKVSKQQNVTLITSLNLTLAKESGRKIRYIENLEHLKKLHTLSLSSNMIEKIEKLDKLTRLRDLNLSYNNLSSLDGLEALSALQVLNVTGNSIEHIPVWLGKKLKALRTVKLAKNQIQSIQEFTKLRPLRDLTQITVSENPVSLLPHCRSFLVFHLRTLDTMDDQSITDGERTAAHNRYAQEELEKLQQQLEQQRSQYEKLKADHNRSLGEVERKDTQVKDVRTKVKASEQSVLELQRELQTKNDLLRRKTAELTKACQKHYELEQELAFYKIDHKFGELSRPPPPPSSDSDNQMDDDGGLIGGESPYLGKGRFKKSERARQRNIHATPQQARAGSVTQDSEGYASVVTSAGAMAAQEQRGLTYEEIAERANMTEALDNNLKDKHLAIERAQEKLSCLQRELVQTEGQLNQATEELQKISEVAPGRPLTEDDKQDLRNMLGRKMDKVHSLSDEARSIEQEMEVTRHDLGKQQTEVSKLRGKLRRMGSRDSLYNLVKKEVSEKEHDLQISTAQYNELQRQLEGMIHTISREAEDIRRLEQDLRDGQIARSDELREELEGIIDGLQTYLSDVQQRADRQKDEFDLLVQDKAALEDLLREASKDRQQLEQQTEGDRQMMEEQAELITQLREQLTGLEDSLADQRDMNSSLQQHLEESHVRDDEAADISLRLKGADDQLRRLKEALANTQRQAQNDKDDYEKRLEKDRKKLDHLKNRAREANMKDDEIGNLHNQLTSLQMSNAGLQDQVYKLQEGLKAEQNKSTNPDVLRRRLADMMRVLHNKGLEDASPRRGRHDDQDADPVEEALGEMEDRVTDTLDKSFKEVEHANRAREQAEADVMEMKDQIIQVQEKEREMAEQAIQAMMDEEHQESERLRRQIDRLKAELERERELSRERAKIPQRLLEPSPKSSRTMATTTTATPTATETATATTTEGTTVTTETETDATTDTEETSTIPSSQWSHKKQEIYDMMSPEEQDLFDELQEEIEQLRKLLMMQGKDKDVVKKASQAAQTASMLREMIENRPSVSSGSKRHKDSRSTGDSGTGSVGDVKVSGKKGGKSKGLSSKELKALPPHTREALKQLDRAQGEISQLQGQLKMRNALIKEEMIRSDKTNYTIAAKQDEIEELHAVLEEQKNELDQLTGARPRDGDTRRAPSGGRGGRHTDQLDSRVRHDGDSVRPYDDIDYHPQDGRSTHRGGALQERGRGVRANSRGGSDQIDPHYIDPVHGEPHHSSHKAHRDPSPQRHYSPQRKATSPQRRAHSPQRPHNGRPVPTFYSPDGQEIPHPEEEYYRDDRRAQYHQRSNGYNDGGDPYDYADYDNGPSQQYPGQRIAGPHSMGPQGSMAPHRGMSHSQHVGPNMGIPPPGPNAAHYGASMANQPIGPTMGSHAVDAQMGNQYNGVQGNQAPGLYGNQNAGIQGTHPQGIGAGQSIGIQGSMQGSQPAFNVGQPVLPNGQPFGFQGNQVPNGFLGQGHVSSGIQQVGGQPQTLAGSMASGGMMQPTGLPASTTGAAFALDAQGNLVQTTPGVATQGMATPGTPGTSMYPLTPQGQQMSGQPILLPTTPLAGSAMGQVLSGPNTPAATMAQPMMMSTPVAGMIDAATGQPIKGILKKGAVTGDVEEADLKLMCNVPEHHDLEDYISQLQSKVKKLKLKLQDDEELSLEDSKRVLFEEDVQRDTICRLQEELEDRRQELESLDLAIERQKSNLDKMGRKEQKLKVKRRAAREELSRVQGRKTRAKARRQAFLAGDTDLDVSDTDYDYEVPVYAGVGRREHVQREVACLEETLARRRAELRAADKLLTECEFDLSQARAQTKANVDQYQDTRGRYQATIEEVQEIEQRAHDTAALLIKAEDELAHVTTDTDTLRAEREQHQAVLREIQKVITNKDAEFQNIDLKIKQSAQKLHDVQFELQNSEGRHHDQIALMKENDYTIADKKRELDHILKKISSDEADLEQTSSRLTTSRSELERTEDALRKRRRQLDDLDKDLDLEVDRRRNEIKDLDRQLGDLQHDRRKYDQDLHQIRQNIEHEESVLQSVAALVSQRKEELQKTETALKSLSVQLLGNRSENSEKQGALQQVVARIAEEEAEMDRLRTESQRRSAELEALQRRASQGRDEIDTLQGQRRSLEAAVGNLREEKASLEESSQEVKRRLSELHRSHSDAEKTTAAAQRHLASLEAQMSRVETLLDSGLSDELRASDDRDSRTELHFLDSGEEENLEQSAGRHGTLEERIKKLGKEISRREQEKEQIRMALGKSCQELHELHRTSKQERDELMINMRHLEAEKRGLRQELDDRSKELIQHRNKTAHEIADLETIAQNHCCRANRLGDELSYLRAEYMEVKRKLDCQEEIAERDKRLEESIRDLKSDIKFDVTETIIDQEQQKNEALEEQRELVQQNHSLANQLSSLKQNMVKPLSQSPVKRDPALVQSRDSGIGNSSDNLKESMVEHQTFLKKQLQSKMARQAEILQAQRLMPNDSIVNLQRKLASIEQVFSQSDSFRLSGLSDSQKLSSDFNSSVTKSSNTGTDNSSDSQESTESRGFPKRAYSPHRYSNNRNKKTLSSPQVPEKDLS